jgi:tRNA 2-selenouridine synthase
MGGLIEKTTFPFSAKNDFTEIIDVRSPAEFEEDHVTGAINLPVLSNVERVEIGIIYKQISTFEARKKGAAMVSRNIAAHIENYFMGKPQAYRPLIYCWRGGHRSESMAQVLSQIGWHVYLLEGGYRTYRQWVTSEIAMQMADLNLVVLNGLTGAGKTLVLRELQHQGEQILDLESLARHKGSVFGGDPQNPQPAQKRFESLLYDELIALDPARPVYIEAESAKIGKINLPNSLWQKMRKSRVIELFAPLESRAEYLTHDYQEWLSDLERVDRSIDRLKGFHSDQRLGEWKEMARLKHWKALAASLLAEHYDRRYRPEIEKSHFQAPFRRFEIIPHDESSLKTCVKAIKELPIPVS